MVVKNCYNTSPAWTMEVAYLGCLLVCLTGGPCGRLGSCVFPALYQVCGRQIWGLFSKVEENGYGRGGDITDCLIKLVFCDLRVWLLVDIGTLIYFDCTDNSISRIYNTKTIRGRSLVFVMCASLIAWKNPRRLQALGPCASGLSKCESQRWSLGEPG